MPLRQAQARAKARHIDLVWLVDHYATLIAARMVDGLVQPLLDALKSLGHSFLEAA